MATQAASISLIVSELQLIIVTQLNCCTEPCGQVFSITVQYYCTTILAV
jgi:hypothetical protein